MPQRDHLFEWLTIFDNACLGLKIQKQLSGESKEYVRSLFDKYGLSGFDGPPSVRAFRRHETARRPDTHPCRKAGASPS